MPPQEINTWENNIDGAKKEIIDFLEGTGKAKDVIYFDGWDGWGASAVLKEVAKQIEEKKVAKRQGSSSSLSSSQGVSMGVEIGLDKIIQIDCSLWQSKRALQKTIAKELNLSRKVMAIFDQHDEEDNFSGVEEGARRVIPRVTEAILKNLHNRTFLVVFHNGSNGYIDLRECGVLVATPLRKRVLWTSRGRFRFDGVQEDDITMKLAGLSDVALSARSEVGIDSCLLYTRLLRAEAEEVARYTGIPKHDISQETIIECILYMVLRSSDNIDWGTHMTNYWVCDGIIQATTDGGRSAWEIADALQRNMNFDWHEFVAESICDILLCGEQLRGSDRWVSATHQNAAAVQVPPHATSFFWTTAGLSANNNITPIVEAAMFEHSVPSRLRVLHLSHRIFDFSSPPFLSCSNLRFLYLNHCKDKDIVVEAHHHQSHIKHDDGTCFHKLWVLDLSYTDWYWLLSTEMIGLMADLRELNVKGVKNWSISHLCRRGRCSDVGSNNCSLFRLRVTIDPTYTNQASPAVGFPDMSSWSILKTIILDSCVDLGQIGSHALPPLIESFGFFSNVPTRIKSISFRGCNQFKTLLLRGLLTTLEKMDLSGTSVKTLDLSMVQAPSLRCLVLLGCEELCAILWPKGKKVLLDVVRIDTTHATLSRGENSDKQEARSDETSSGSSSATMLGRGQAPTDFKVFIFVRDARLLRSFEHVFVNKHLLHKYLQIEISSARTTTASGGHKDVKQGINSIIGYGEQQGQAASPHMTNGSIYDDKFVAALKDNSQDCGANRGASDDPFITCMWPCPPIPWDNSWLHCYISILDEMETKLPQGATGTEQVTSETTLPAFVSSQATTLHLHDNFSITSIPGPALAEQDLSWKQLLWCRLERCPNLGGTVFTSPPRSHGPDWRVLNDFRNLRMFWASRLLKARYIWDWTGFGFRDLVLLHLDYCPRLIHILPLGSSVLHSLETIEIVCCSNLREVFPMDMKSLLLEPIEFPFLRHIHLHELPMLERICGRRMSASDLRTVNIKGCWSLKCLPAVGSSKRWWLPEVDCEKEWWNRLEWDGEEANHHPSLYKVRNSKYYKKTMLKGPILR